MGLVRLYYANLFLSVTQSSIMLVGGLGGSGNGHGVNSSALTKLLHGQGQGSSVDNLPESLVSILLNEALGRLLQRSLSVGVESGAGPAKQTAGSSAKHRPADKCGD